MYRVAMFSVNPASLKSSPVYQETESVYSCVFSTDDLQELDNCFKIETYEQGIEFATKFPQYNSALVKEEFATVPIDNDLSKVKLHTISPKYTWQDVDELYKLLLVTPLASSSSAFMHHYMSEAYGDLKLFEAYSMIIPPKEIHEYLLNPENYEYVPTPKDDITGRMNYAYTLLKKADITYIDVVHLNRALTEVQYILYPPVDKLFFTGMPVHRTLAQKDYPAIADWMLSLYFTTDNERRKKKYDSVVNNKMLVLIMFYLQAFYNNLTMYGSFTKCFRFPNDLAVPTSTVKIERLKVYLFACSNDKKTLERFVKQNKLACTINHKAGMYVIDEPTYEKIKGTPLSKIEDCVSKVLSSAYGVFWTTYTK